jgi:hypothetical protein
MPDLPRILYNPYPTKPEMSADLTPMDVYIHGIEESEFLAINQRAQEKMATQKEFEGWKKPGNEGMSAVFDSLKRAAGARGFTFLGRPVTKDMTFEDVLKKIPAAELEEAGSAIKAVLSPQSYQRFDAVRAMLYTMFGLDWLMTTPGGTVKYLRRKSQEYLDPHGEVMERRLPQNTFWETLRILGRMREDKADY